MDSGGRLLKDVAQVDTTATYELVFQTGDYWRERVEPRHGARVMSEIVIRFTMPDPEGRYHIPLILSPNGYSMWCSTEHG